MCCSRWTTGRGKTIGGVWVIFSHKNNSDTLKGVPVQCHPYPPSGTCRELHAFHC